MGYLYGLKKGIPIMLGYIAVSFSFGVMAVDSYGITPLTAIIISLTNVTSSGQQAGVEMISHGLSLFEIGLTVLLINLRYSLMSLSLSQKLDSTTPTGLRLLFGFGITDEIYAIAVTEKEKINARYMFGIITLPIIGWVLGTTLGAFASKLIPDEKLLDALSIALYAMFIAIIIPDARRSLKITFVILLSISISCLFYYVPFIKEIGIGFKIIISTVISALLGAIIFPINDEINEIEYSSKDGDDNA